MIRTSFQLFRIKPFGWVPRFNVIPRGDRSKVSNYSELNHSVGAVGVDIIAFVGIYIGGFPTIPN